MSAPLRCLVCEREHGSGPQPWKRIPEWIRVCDVCRALAGSLPTRDRVLMGLVRMPLSDGAGTVARCAGVAESTARRWLPVLVAERLATGPLVHSIWMPTYPGIMHALSLVRV